MDKTEEVVITPHPGQAKILTSPKRFLLAAAGIQGGKTFCGCIWEQLEIQKNPQGNHLICGLSHDQLNNAIITKFFGLFPPYRKYYNKKDKTVYLPSGGHIFFRSLEDPRYVEGITAHSAWIDEADLVGYKGYLVVRGRLNATGGRLLMTSSISDNSWLAEYISKFNEDEFEIVSWASKENPAFSREEWESLKRELDPTLFRRRYEADFSFGTGRVYSLFTPEKHMLEKIPADEIVTKSFIGIDWGYVDPTAIVVVQLTNKKKLYVVDEFVVEGAPLDLIVAVVKKFKQQYQVKHVFADPSNKIFLEAVQSRTGAIMGGNRDIFFGTSTIRNLIFQDRLFVLTKCKHVLREIKMYRFKEGLVMRSEEPEDKNNHAMDAIRYVIATYPIPSVRYRKDQEEEVPDFWLRRGNTYKRELNRSKEKYGDDIIIP